MTDVLQKAFSGDTDRKVAQGNASEVAKLLSSKSAPNTKMVLNESYYPFKIPIHSERFHCFLFVSDAQCRFTAKCHARKGDAGESAFFVSLKNPASHMFAKTRVDEVSKKLGVDVYRQPFLTDNEIEAAILSQGTWDLLRKVDFGAVSQFHLSPFQLGVAYSFHSAAFCAGQALLFRDLVGVVFEEACQRNKQGLG